MSISQAELMEIVQRSMERATHSTHLRMKRRLAGLATIASTAPFVGLFGTVLGLMNAFRGYIGERTELLIVTSVGIQEALVTTALGLVVAVPAVWSYNYFTDRVEGFRIEMENSSRELLNYLLFYVRRRGQGSVS